MPAEMPRYAFRHVIPARFILAIHVEFPRGLFSPYVLVAQSPIYLIF